MITKQNYLEAKKIVEDFEREQEENKTQNSELMFKALQWLATGDSGRSSETICFYLLGVDYLYLTHPYDRADFGRCYRLLEFIPDFRLRLDELRAISPE